MAKYQYPIDGKMGKNWKVSSYMGWRVHPVTKGKKHHNGTDIIPIGAAPYIEAFADGKVLESRKSTAAGGGFGNFVIIQHKINGVFFTSCYAHMADGTIKVKKGQKVKAGTVLGKMGTTGMSTGVHLHFEIWRGKTHGWSADGKGFVEPLKFIKGLIAAQEAIEDAPNATPPAPATKPVAAAKPTIPVAKPVAKPKPVAKLPNPGYPGVYLKSGSSGLAVKYLQQQLKVPVTGSFNAATATAVKALQKRSKLKVDGIVGPLTWKKLG